MLKGKVTIGMRYHVAQDAADPSKSVVSPYPIRGLQYSKNFRR